MKTTALPSWSVVCACALVASAAFTASADQAGTVTKPAKSYTGTVAAVDQPEHMLHVKGTLLNKTFNLGNTCSYVFLDKPSGTAGDLRPGQKVTVRYQDARGVLIADRVQQQPMRFEGTIKAIDPAKNVVVLRVAASDKNLQLPSDCRVVLRNAKSGTLSDLQPGHRVTVTYELPKGATIAREIAQTSDTFTGTLTAIDLTDETLKAKAAFSSKKFHLADGCVIVLNGKTGAGLSDLKPGDKLTFSYDEVNGVNIVNRISNTTGSPETMTATSK